MALWRHRLRSTAESHRAKREVSYSVEGVGGNAKTGIRFYGKGSPTLKVKQKQSINKSRSRFSSVGRASGSQIF